MGHLDADYQYSMPINIFGLFSKISSILNATLAVQIGRHSIYGKELIPSIQIS